MRILFSMNAPKNGYFAHVKRCIGLLSRKAKGIFFTILIFQSIISVFDLIGLALIMKVVLGFQVNSSSVQASPFQLSVPFVGNLLSNTNQEIILILVILIFIIKGLLALILHTMNVRIMQAETVKLTRRLTNSIFRNRNSNFKKLTTQDISYAIYNATEMVFRDTLIPAAVILADSVLLLVVAINLFVNAKLLLLPTILYFVLVFFALRRLERNKTRIAFKTQLSKEIELRSRIHEANSSLRELYVSSKLQWKIDRIVRLRADASKAGSVVTLSQLRPKYIYEMALFGGIGLIAIISKISGNKELVLTYLVLFVVSSSRMIPALMRTQYYLGIFQKSREQTSRIFDVLSQRGVPEDFEGWNMESKIQAFDGNFVPTIDVQNVSFSYGSETSNPTVDEINFGISSGETVALVGPSGAGKSTIIDLILGFLEPTKGAVLISGMEPRRAFDIWPGRVAYVPQKVTIYEDTLLANIAVGVDCDGDGEIRARVVNLLEKVDLRNLLDNMEDGLDTKLSEAGSNLSGGQVQRIGIARALFTNPSILVLDESTSSLDSSTEHAVMEYIFNLGTNMTLIIIAHRLSTIRDANKILYVNNGRIEAQGNFEEIRNLIPNFEQQVKYLNS